MRAEGSPKELGLDVFVRNAQLLEFPALLALAKLELERILADTVLFAVNGIDYDEAGLQKLIAELGLEENVEPPPLVDDEN